MPKVSDALRKKLLDQKKEMGQRGLLIVNKDWTKGRVRVLPCGDEIPGHRVVSYYCDTLQTDRKGTTSPETFGLPCPIAEAFRKLKGEDEAVRDRAYNTVRTTVEYWVPVLVRGEEGTAELPNIRIFPMKKSVYSKVQGFMIDEDVGEDITDVKTGRDLLIKKTGTMKNTEWTVDKLDPSPLHKDQEMRNAIIAASDALDVRHHFFPVDYDILGKIYEALTGDEMPAHFAQAGKGSTPAKAASKAKATKATKVAADDADEDHDTPAEAADAIVDGSRVSFEGDDGVMLGTVKSIDDDDDATVEDDDGQEWTVAVDALTLVEGEAPEAEDDADEDEAESESTPEIAKGSKVSFANGDDTVTGTVASIKGTTVRVADDEGEDWDVEMDSLTLAESEDDGEDEAPAEDDAADADEAEEEPPKVSRKAPAKKPAAEPEEPPNRKATARKPGAGAVARGKVAAKPAVKPAKAADKIRKAKKG